MSVLKSKRVLSPHEYVTNFIDLYKYTEERLAGVPKRKRKWLCEPIILKMNSIYNIIADSNCDYYISNTKLCDNTDIANEIINELLNLQRPLLALWNIEKYKTQKMAHWSDLINEEINYVKRIGVIKEEKAKLFIIDYEAVNKADFLKALSKLHRLIYSKTISLPDNIRGAKGLLLMRLADDALYYAYDANRFVPTTKAMYDARAKKMIKAYKRLKAMDNPMFSLFNLMGYSEKTMIEMANALQDATNLLYGVIKSDKERFKDLE